MVELKRELRSSLLKKYINNINFSQNLISKQNQINLVLEEYIGKKILESQIIKKNKKNSFNPLSRNITNIIKLFNLRSLFKLNPGFDSEDIIAKKFIEIIDTTDQLISDWNGKLYFVYLPAYSKYSVGKDFGYYNSIIHIIKKLGIEVIDIHEEGFSNHPDPISLYTFRLANHYNVDGYELVSKIIKKRLDQE